MVASRRVQGEEGASECSWYFVQFNFDNTMGVTLTILLHQAIVTLATSYVQRTLFKESSDELSLVEIIAHCGNYGTPPKVPLLLQLRREWFVCLDLSLVYSSCRMAVCSGRCSEYNWRFCYPPFKCCSAAYCAVHGWCVWRTECSSFVLCPCRLSYVLFDDCRLDSGRIVEKKTGDKSNSGFPRRIRAFNLCF